MIIYVDIKTLALTTEGHVPLTDMALVRGDKIPLRIVLTDGPGLPADTKEVPVLAVKKSLGDDALVLAATGLERVTDALGTAYVGSLSVNTTQLATAMGNQDRIDLVGEVVLVAPDGAQRTSRLVRVTVRADLLPGDYAPPDDVLADWPTLVATALAAQLPEALQASGVYVDPVPGSSTLSTGQAETPTVMACYAISWGDELLAGHLTDSCRLRNVTMTYYTDTGLTEAHWLRVWRLVGGKYVVIGVASPVALPANNQPIAWGFTPGVSLRRGDNILMEICAGQDADHLTTRGLGVHAVMTTAKDGRGIAAAVSYPPEITLATLAPMMSVTVDYDEGVSVGGVELATVTQVQALGSDMRTASVNSQAAAQSAAAARDQAQAAVAGLSITTGTVTTAEPGSQASAAMTPGSTPGSWQLDMTIPRGAVGAVDASQAYTWTQPQTYDAMINANGGINAVSSLAAGVPKTGLNAGSQAVLSVLENVHHLDHVNGTVTTLEGSNVKLECVLQGWCGVSWVGSSTAHKCLLIKTRQTNSNYCGAWSPMGTSDYALVMSYLSGVNMVDTSTKFGFTGYSGTVAATTIEDIPGPSFFTDCVNKKIVAKNAEGETTELPWAGISLDQVSRLDLIVIPSSYTACKIYLSIHQSVRTAHGNHYNFNRRYLVPQVYYVGEVPLGLSSNDCHYALLDNNSEQMVLFRVSVIQGINMADYLNVKTI